MVQKDHFEYVVLADCPVPNAHRRIEQAHRLWHQALDEYADPDAFLANLNATIEALRNVTFVLQGEKDRIPEFAEWYAPLQAAMKEDPILKWLNDARVTVVHRSDLEVASKARVRVHNNLVHLVHELDVPPGAPTEAICHILAERLPDQFREPTASLLIAVERSWRVSPLGDTELLGALAHAYAHLRRIVEAAHARAGRECPSGVSHIGKDGLLPCMRETAGLRTIRLSLVDGAPILTKKVRVNQTTAGAAEAVQRYGLTRPKPQLSMQEQAAWLMTTAKKMLAKDKYHLRFIHLYANGKPVSLIQGDTDTRETKYVLMREVAEEVRRFDADALIDISEAWTAPMQDVQRAGSAERAANRREVLVVTLAEQSGNCFQVVTPFDRAPDGQIVFAETQQQNVPFPAYLTPIAEAWGLQGGSRPPAG